jgi:hypothetical protein
MGGAAVSCYCTYRPVCILVRIEPKNRPLMKERTEYSLKHGRPISGASTRVLICVAPEEEIQ